MTAGSTSTTDSIEVFLPDGTHVVFAFAGNASHDVELEEAVMEIVLSAGETDREFRTRVKEQLAELGLAASTTAIGREHLIVVRDELP